MYFQLGFLQDKNFWINKFPIKATFSMDTALVTGSTGFVGAHVTRLLIQKKMKVRCLVRKSSDLQNLKGLDVEILFGELLDQKSVRNAVKNVNYVFHIAADYRLWSKDPKEIYQTNVNGTKNLMEACLAEEVTRIVYTSSVATIGQARMGTIATEKDVGSLDQMVGHYKRSKFLAEQSVSHMARQGLPVVIVNPSTPIGPKDIRPTPTGKIILDFLNKKMPAYVDTGLNFAGVDDVAYGHWLALVRGKIGHRYILGGENMRLIDFLKRLAKICNRPAPKFRIPFWIALGIGGLCSTISSITHREPAVPLEGVRMAKRKMFFDSSKAEQELGYKHKCIDHSVRESITWFVKHGYTDFKGSIEG